MAAAALLPLVLVPLALYTVEVSLLAARQSRLSGAVAQAAEDAAQQLDTAQYRRTGVIQLQADRAQAVASASLAASDPTAMLEQAAPAGTDGFAVSAREVVALQVAFLWPGAQVTLRATGAARLRVGFDASLG